MMATNRNNEILHNVQYFMGELLETIRTADGWTSDEMNGARKWAEYCNKFSLKMQQLGLFDTCVKVLASRMDDMDVEKILTTLHDPIGALNRAFLTNSSLDSATLAKLLDMNLTDQSLADAFLEDFSRVVVDNNIADQLTSISPTELLSTDLKEFHENLRRELIVAQLTEVLRDNESHNFDDYLEGSFVAQEPLVQLVGNLNLLAAASSDSQCFERAISKLVQKCTIDLSARYLMLNKEQVDVLGLASQSELFFDFYTNTLHEECESLYRDENNLDDTWQNGSDGHLSYTSLEKQWTALMNAKPPIGATTLDMVKEFVITSTHLVWLDILKKAPN